MKTLFRFPFRSRDEVLDDVEDEFTFHIDMRTAELVRDGLSETHARQQALEEFGNRRQGVERCTTTDTRLEIRKRRLARLGELGQDLRFALRLLRRRPAFTAVAVATLAVGIGANTAIFSLFEQTLVRPLPVADPAALVNLSAPGPKPGGDSCDEAGPCSVVFSHPMFLDLQREQTPFTGIAAHRSFLANLSYGAQATSGHGMLVSGNYFDLLGLVPAAGRLIGVADDGAPDTGDAVVLSHDQWRLQYAASPDVIGKTLTVNGHPMTIVGVAPQGFTGTTLGIRPLAFVPVSAARNMLLSRRSFERRRSWLYLFARLAPGVSLEQARTHINVPYRHIINEVEAPELTEMSERGMAAFRARTVEVEPGARGQSALHASLGTPLKLLLLVTATVLLVACANIANLLLARSTERAGEMAVRLSLGASRAQLVGLLLTESCVLAAIGGAAGLLVAHATLSALTALMPQENLATFTLALDSRAVLSAAALSLVTGLLFGLYPALHSTRRDLMVSLRDRAGQTTSPSARRFRAALVTAQIALATALLVSAGLFIRSLVNVTSVELGIRPENVVSFRMAPALSGYTPERSLQLFEQLEDDLAALPGVTSATASLMPLLSSSTTGGNIRVEGFDNGPDTNRNVRANQVGVGFLRTLGMTLLGGRDIASTDGPDAPRVALVNEAFVRQFNLGGHAVGTRMADWTSPDEGFDTEIVGVVKDAHYADVREAAVPSVVFRPYRQVPPQGFTYFYARTSTAPESLLAAIPRVVANRDPYLPIEMLKTMPQQVRENVYVDRMIGFLSATYALVATLLAALGLYGVLAYTVGQRTREIGLRMALGADARVVRGMVLGQVARLTLAGVVLGIVAALAIGRMAQALLYELDGHDPLAIGGAAVALAAVALAAGYLPARRASTIDPMRALRWE
ncbi:MAG: ABC transporter permease [Acidobacteria bacterium]|nr:ABC transporter permease [Acidobacteriota bacterium]